MNSNATMSVQPPRSDRALSVQPKIIPISLKILENLENRWLMWASHCRREGVLLMGRSPRSHDLDHRSIYYMIRARIKWRVGS